MRENQTYRRVCEVPGKTGVDELSEDSDFVYPDFLWGCFYDHGF
mgnify:CR=1 FL=1